MFLEFIFVSFCMMLLLSSLPLPSSPLLLQKDWLCYNCWSAVVAIVVSLFADFTAVMTVDFVVELIVLVVDVPRGGGGGLFPIADVTVAIAAVTIIIPFGAVIAVVIVAVPLFMLLMLL